MDIGNGPILVFGATGRQGGAVAHHLLQHEFEVHAVTRNPASEAAQGLREEGVRVYQGDMSDRESLKGPLARARAVYSVQNYWETGAELEIEQGRNVADLCQAYDIPFIVYSSVGGADRDTGIPHFDSKYLIEEHIRSLPLSWCVLRPVWFMENLLAPEMWQSLQRGVLSLPLPADVPLQMIAVDDIGIFATMAFMEPLEWSSRALEIAGDELTMPEVARMLSRRLGHEIEYQPIPIEQLPEEDEDSRSMFQWFVDEGYQAPIDELRVLHPGLLNFEQWLNVTFPAEQHAPGEDRHVRMGV